MAKNEWDLSPLFSSDDDPTIEERRRLLEKSCYDFVCEWKQRTDYLSNPAALKQALDDYAHLRKYYGTDGDEGYYFWLRTQQDMNDPVLKARFNKIEEFSKRAENDTQFFYLAIGKIPQHEQDKFLIYPLLREYRHFLERIFAEARYMLSEPEERILNLKASPAHSDWVKMTAGFLVKEEKQVLLENGSTALKPFSEILSLVNSHHKRVRDRAARALNEILEKHREAAEAEINSLLLNKKIDDELRKVARPDTLRHLSDDIDTEIVDTLVQTVAGRFDIPNRFYALKARLLGIRRLKYHERNVTYGTVDQRYSYAKTVRIIEKVMKELDPEFAAILKSFCARGQIDVYPKKGKASGAFCVHHLMTQPTYILLNHTGTLHDVLTMAHELGHGINNELIKKKQNALNFGSPLSTAEVASTFMEDFVLEEIRSKADTETRLSIMMMKLNDDVSTIFRQVACYRFEQELHAEFRKIGYLSSADIGRLFQRHMGAYMGDAVEQSPGSENWWIHWSHIRSFFYVYSYVSGLLISKSLQNSVRKDPAFIRKVKEFLSEGLADSPQSIFMKLGIDISGRDFWSRGIDEVEALLDETEDLAKTAGKLGRSRQK